MGADEFMTYQEGTDAGQAYRDAVERARHEHGHGGGTGTIADKDPAAGRLVILRSEPLPLAEARELARQLLSRADADRGPGWDDSIADKYGATGAIAVSGGDRTIDLAVPERPGGWDTSADAARAALGQAGLPEGATADLRRVRGCFNAETGGRRAGRIISGEMSIPVTGGTQHTGWLLIGTAPS